MPPTSPTDPTMTAPSSPPPPEPAEALRERVRTRYATAALAVRPRSTDGCCCAPGAAEPVVAPTAEAPFGAGQYRDVDREHLPAAAVAASLGCGNPLLVADLVPGERVLDLGSGGGIDVLLSARRVGPAGRAFGLDMTDEMLDLARHNAADAGAENVEFLKGTIEAIPLPAGSIDVVISNCVINLSGDKPAVFTEIFRVLRPGGRLGISDIVAEDHLTPQQRATLGDWEGCTAGALSRREYVEQLRAAGFEAIDVRFTHAAADGMHAAIVRAGKPAH